VTVLAGFIALAAATLAALCAFADGALLGLDADEPPSDARTRALLERRERAHRALAFGRIVAQLLSGAATTVALLATGWLPAAWATPGVVVAGIALLGITEVGARAAGDVAGARGLARVGGVVEAVEWLGAPVVTFGQWADDALMALLPPPTPDDDDHDDAVERFREVVAAEADVTPQEEVLIHGVFSLGDTKVASIMVPRVDIVGLEQDTPWSEVVDRVRSARHARLVVYDGTLDEVVGILYAKDLLPALLADEEPAAGWRSLVKPAAFIPESKTVEAQLREFRTTHRHLAIVADEFGGTAGLVTLEDVLELIIGDIQDEGDAELPEVERAEGGRLWVAATVTLEQLSELTDHDWTRGDVSTVGGLVMEILGRVPKPGETIFLDGYKLVVERVVRRRVHRVYLEPELQAQPAEGA
jgi:CBS domain containing-hemolysin-like protein